MADEKKIASAIPNGDEEHPDYPGLTRAEVAAEKEAAQREVAKELKKKRLAAIREQEKINLMDAMGETERFQKETDTLTPVNREMVDITLNLAPWTPDIRIDGVIYRHRGKYTVTRAKACELLYQQFQGFQQESRRLGQDPYSFYSQMQQMANSIPTRSGLRSSVVINSAGSIVAGRAPTGTH